MTGRGRPLRFLALVALAWLGGRIALLWHQTGSLPQAAREIVPLIGRTTAEPHQETPPVLSVRSVPAGAARTVRRARLPPATLPLVPAGAEFASTGQRESETALPGSQDAATPAELIPLVLAERPHADRWQAAAWLVARGGSGFSPAAGGQLGGGQAGLRLAYALAPEARIALVGRLAAPLAGRGAEAAVGVEWQPTRLPLRLVVEHRIGLDGTQGGPGMGAIAGVDGVSLPAGFRLEAYGQAGVIARERAEPYADGAARVLHPVDAGGVRLGVGAGLWGAAQRGATRLDIGPSLTLALPLGEAAVRMTLDWRQRIGGDAAPGSGPVLTLGGDF